mgnify:CR=1 FL=1|tara:strand:- start:1762 stop:2103 length:342 start_codon:yes stop_codon:yes gene_type:complete
MNIAIGILFFAIGNLIAWFQFNSQFVWSWWENKPIITNLIYAVPMGLCFWMAAKYIVGETGELWSSKLIGFGVSQTIFPILTYLLMKESMFTVKTMICISLSFVIVGVQIFWK